MGTLTVEEQVEKEPEEKKPDEKKPEEFDKFGKKKSQEEPVEPKKEEPVEKKPEEKKKPSKFDKFGPKKKSKEEVKPEEKKPEEKEPTKDKPAGEKKPVDETTAVQIITNADKTIEISLDEETLTVEEPVEMEPEEKKRDE